MSRRVLVAMSGGVDSSVAALLLKQQGYEVIGAHMKLWDYAETLGELNRVSGCCDISSITTCRFVCDSIDAPFYVLNFSDTFKEEVIDNFIAEYKAGRTPNPCIRCNARVRWDAFLKKAAELGCSHIATGHYAFVEQGNNGRWQLRKGVDHTRDQSYVLWGLSQESLSKTLMPLGGYLKKDVREIARQHNLKSAEKPESREICFVPDNDYGKFLHNHEQRQGRELKPGEIVHEDGRVLGEHAGIAYYTVGQRRGLGIAHPTPLYVLRVDPKKNQVVVGDNDSTLQGECDIDQVNWISMAPTEQLFECEVKIRYQHRAAPATITPLTDKRLHIIFKEKQRAVTPGQSAVFYDNDRLLGGGVIA